METHRFAISLVFLLSLSTLSHSRHLLEVSNSLDSVLSEPGVCQTPGCVKAAEQLLYSMDATVDPCDNFYKFACGGFMKKTVIPEDKPEKNIFGEMQTDLNKKIIGLLEKDPESSDPPYAQMLKNMYGSCMDLESIEREGNEPLKNVLRQLGGWPVVEGRGWNSTGYDWINSIFTMKRLGYSTDIIFEVGVSPDLRNNRLHMLNLDQASLGMPDRSYLLQGLSDEHTAAYYKLMVDAAKLLGADQATAETELLQALNFEKALANYSMPAEDRRDYNRLYNKYTIAEIQNLAPQVPWLRYFNGLLNDEVFEDQSVVVSAPNFVDKTSALIASSDKRVIANYIMWRVVRESINMLPTQWKNISKPYGDLFSGSTQEPERSQVCLKSVIGDLRVATGSYYAKNYFKEESKEAALVLVNYIKKEFLNILRDVDWMDEETRKEAIEKAKGIRPYIGYPAELINDTAVMKFYENLTLSNGSYFDNTLRLNRWSTNVMLADFNKPAEKGRWIMHANIVEVNAYYNPQENTIDFPASILQNAFFDKDRPFYMNFGGIGYVIGHEITHGFDDQGRQFDKDGNAVNWWGPQTDELFTQKTQCIINQYGNYTTETGMKLNGLNTLGENIADNGGVKEAYRAYKAWVEDNGPEQTLPGLDYNQNQLFFISVANAWCTKQRPEYVNNLVVTDSHSPSEFRIVGPLSNFPDFSTEFNCPLGSPMNKPNKCQVW